MIRLCAILALVITAPAFAQLQILAETPEGLKPVASVYDMGATNVGEAKDLWLQARNSGAAAETINTLTTETRGFNVLNQPTLPATVQPGASVRFRVQFNPPSGGSFSATLRVNQKAMVILRASSNVVAALILEEGASRTVLSAGQTVDFGRVEKGAAIAKRFRIESIGGTVVTASSLSVTGESFQIVEEPSLPLVLPPRESVEFSVEFHPPSSGAYQARLQFDNRAFVLQGVGIEPPLPRARLEVSAEAPTSASQMRVSVALAAVSRTTGTGRVKLAFRPDAGLGEDPGAYFPQYPDPGRAAPFRILEGEQVAHFGDAEDVAFQTGTTAGMITLVLELEGQSGEVNLVIPKAPPALDRIDTARRTGSIEITVNGYDNTRSVSSLVFSFYDQIGQVMGTPIRVDASGAFGRHFSGTSVGGMFSLRAVFPVTGDTGAVREMELEMSNSSGVARTGRIQIQ